MLEILCTVSGAIAGSAIVASLMQNQAERTRPQPQDLANAEESERLTGLADKLDVLTKRVSADVSAHTDKVFGISERLSPVKNEPALVNYAISELLEVNEAVQFQLAEAQNLLNQQSQQIEAATREARTDSLTGLSNRRALDEFMKGCIQPAPPQEISSLLMLDIDHFKSFNDTYGHATGDAVLASFARCIAEWCNGKYYAARYGGEEFAVMMTGKSMEAIAKQAADLRAHVSERAISHEDLRLNFTASGGLAPLLPGDTAADAYKRADKGLYLAKSSGRNCGYWLQGDEWVRFELTKIEIEREAAKQAEIAIESKKAALPGSPAAQPAAKMLASPPAAVAERKQRPASTAADTAADKSDSRPDVQHDSGSPADILDLDLFFQKLDVHLTQLHRAELPATAIMIHAEGLDLLSPSNEELGWDHTLSIVQLHVRGIDVVGHTGKHSLCIFLPGTSLITATDRASRIQQGLAASRAVAPPTSPLPQRLSISLATATPDETPDAFMQRLETALAVALQAQPDEIVVHNGKTCQVQTA